MRRSIATPSLQNFIAGSDPNASDSVFKLSVAVDGNEKVISFQTLPAEGTGYEAKERFYSLESSASLAGNSWTPVPGFGKVLGVNQTVIYQATVTSPNFYRAAVWLEEP